ncbi:unnamed protein product [Effrenium voratum]|nr:unnamed protein product [Effrenium voratum]
MTFNDSVTSPPLIRPEERPLKPIKIYEIRPRADAKPELEQLPDEFSRAEWVQFTSIRMPGGITITEWKAPEFKGEQRVAPRFPAQGDGFNGAAGARMGGKVHMRTRGGSDDNNKRSGGPRPLKQEVNENKTRYFYGTIQEFKDNLALKLGDTGTFQEFNDQKRVTWTASADLGTKIEFREINKQVTITGKEGSVRHMLSTMGFLSYEPPAGYAASETGSRARTSVAGSKAPSKVFESNTRAKPSSIAALSAVKEAPRSNRPSALMEVPYEREVCDELLEVYESELVLRLGDIVDVTEDPHMESDNLERWVFGKNRNTGEQGWFSLAFTRAVGQGA